MCLGFVWNMGNSVINNNAIFEEQSVFLIKHIMETISPSITFYCLLKCIHRKVNKLGKCWYYYTLAHVFILLGLPTKYHGWGFLDYRNLFPQGSGELNSEIKVSAGLFASEGLERESVPCLLPSFWWFTGCYGLNYVPLKILCWSLNLQLSQNMIFFRGSIFIKLIKLKRGH